MQQNGSDGLSTESLLIEAYKNKTAEIFENVVFEGKKRYYVEDLTQRDFALENTTPYQCEVLGKVFTERAWGNLLCKVSEELLDKFPDRLATVFDFRCQWSRQAMFSKDQKTNHKPIKQGLFVNVNHTALHCCWFLQDLFDYFGVDRSSVILLIHRPSGAEPQNVREYIKERVKNDFTAFITDRYKKNVDYTKTKVIKIIDKHLNPILQNLSKSYVDFFLFDDMPMLSNYVNKTKAQLSLSLKYNDDAKKVMDTYLDYLFAFYKIYLK